MAIGATSDRRHIGVELGRGPAGEGLVTRHAVGRGRDVIARFGCSAAAADVATGAVGGDGERAVVHLRPAPGAVGFVAALALRHTGVGGVIGFGGLAKGRRSVAIGATSDRRHIGVELGRGPAGKGLVTRHAVGRGRDVVARFGCSAAAADVATGAVGGDGERAVVHLGAAPGAVGFVAALALRHTGVGGVIGFGGLAKGRRSMTVRTTGDDRHIGVELGRGPAGKGLVTRHAVGRGWDVIARFGASCAAVMAAGAIGGAGKRAVIDLGPAPSGRLVARTAVGRCRHVIPRFARSGAAVVAA